MPFPQGIQTSGQFLKFLVFTLKLSVSIALLYVIFSKIEFGATLNRLHEISAPTVLCVLFLLAGHVLGSALRWRVVLDCLGAQISWRSTLDGTLLERLINQAVPSTIGGDALRMMVAMRQEIPASRAFLSVLFDRALAGGGIVLAVVLGLPFAFNLFSDQSLLNALVTVAGISFLAVAAILFFPSAALKWMAEYGWLKHISALIRMTQDLFAKPRFIMIGFGFSLIVQLFLVLAFQLIAHDLDATLPLTASFVVVPVISLISLVPLTLAGWGVRESAAVFLLAKVGVSAETALAVSILYGLLTLLSACFGGAYWIVTKYLRPIQQD